MKIPLSYNLRNLVVRKTTTLMTALGIGLTVAVLVSSMALTEGLRSAFESTGHPLHLLVLRKGGDSELSSIMNRSAYTEAIRVRPGIARNKDGQVLASLEIVQVINLPSREFPDGTNLSVRGMGPTGLEIREDSKLIQGRWWQPGRREVVVGDAIARQYPDAKLGGRLKFGRGDWEIVGIFKSSQTARNSEIWADANQMASDFGREEVLSSVLIRAEDELALQALVNELPVDPRLQVDVMTEKRYYERQTESGDLIKYLGRFVAIIMAVGSIFAAMNTMYAAVARRSKEIGTLRVLGFSKGSILTSFFLESVFLAILGGLLGLLLVLPLNGLSTGIGSATTFSQVAFELKVTPAVAMAGLLFAVLLGALGGLLPARNAARKQILTALKQI